MIEVYVWKFRGLTVAMGHASMRVGDQYISWWPQGDGRAPKLPGSAGQTLPLYSVAHIHGQSFADDQLLEALDENAEWDESLRAYRDRRTGLRVNPMPPDDTVTLDGLDEARVLDWWHEFNVPGREWSTLGQNCATTVARGLMVGGAEDYAGGLSGWWKSWNAVWQPNDVLRFAQEVRGGLATRRGRHAAINLIRRFCSSPLGFTSITAKMDESGLANALYREGGVNTHLVRTVFEELNARRNTDADDVAEVYVNLLRTRGGSPRAAVASDARLKALLIRTLESGWTSAGEKACVEYLKSL